MYHKKKDGIYYSHAKGRSMIHKGYATSIYWNKQMIDDITRLYPTTKNEDLADMLGVSLRTLVRKARELGIKKNKEWLRSVWNENRKLAHLVSKVKGHPGTFQKGCTIGKDYWFKPKQKEVCI